MNKHNIVQDHSSAWVMQTWLSFIISVTATSLGIIYLPVDGWTKSFMGMGLAFTVGSTISLAKTQRDLHEAKKITSRIEEAKVEKLLAEHNNL
ncbi:MAG: hypothetical protein IGR93_19165 [Hydrococcus sp. C42_A2020_068]|uniref:YiaAB two helix domain-containing protein n=1 Tax=Hydrococcus rivularis NIES-593 TaxID=1921803 RepID=A0A1U7HSS5_9CYAN|nr:MULTISPECIES: YiaA/YiaB family inner membrane protein [Pleurocapsales]AFY78397.1 hypothetical protein Ple7327_3169 [Pleurocapsa sp. PCC 7327]MBF2022149.1 hypothetical protein [Hydrococcus sp. C42_A2020_068]OKH26643.1 hypothetical protein NIES593_00870 [Hydrococcus rivularis NIES-593]